MRLKNTERLVRICLVALVALGAVLVVALPQGRQAAMRFYRWATNTGAIEQQSGVYFTCPMHPQIRLPRGGECPICGMDLVEKEAGEEDSSGTIALTPRQMQLAATRSDRIRRRPLVAVIDTVGRIDYDERKLASVAAWIDGRVDVLHVNFTGVTINEGHPLVDLYSPSLISAQEEYLQDLRALKAVSGSPIPETLENTRRLVEATRQRLLWWGLKPEQVEEIERTGKVRSHLTIYAPIGGTVIHKHVVEGQYVKTGETLFQIADLSRIWMYADIYESEIPSLLEAREGDHYECPMHTEVRGEAGDNCSICGMPLERRSPQIELSITTQTYPGEEFTGEVEFTDPFVNPRTRTLRIRCTIDNQDLRLRPDMYVRARMTIAEGKLPAVPESAVIFSGSRRIVIVDEGEGTFRPVLVKLGHMWLWEEEQTPSELTALPFHRGLQRYHEVLAGLREGDRVVTSGSFLINSESQLQGALERMIAAEDEREGIPAATGAFHDSMREVAGEYLKIHDALAKDSLEHVGHMAQALAGKAKGAASTAEGEGEREWAASITTAAEALATKSGVEEIRGAFGALSDALLPYWKSHGPALGMDAHIAYCPMVDRRWIQAGRTIRNPYDTDMLRCGRIEEVEAEEPAEKPAEEPAPETRPATSKGGER